MATKKKAAAETVEVKLVKSLNGRHKKHIATANALGLKRPGDTTVQPVNEATVGKLSQIRYLVEVK